MKTKWILSMGVVAMIAVPSFAALGPIVTVPGTGGHRPTVDADGVVLSGVGATPVINWATYDGSGFGGRHAVVPGTTASTPAASSIITWSPWAMQTGIANQWAVYGAVDPIPGSSDSGIDVENLATGAVVHIAESEASVPGGYGWTDVNSAGDVVWIAWPDAADGVAPTGSRLRTSNVSSGVATAPITLVGDLSTQNGGERMRLSSDSDRIAHRLDSAFGSGASLANVYDLGDGVDYNIFNSDGDQKFYKSAIDDSGNWVVTNMRSVADNTTASDIVLIEVDAAKVAYPITAAVGAGQTYLTGDGSGGAAPTHTRNDPSMDMIDADTALVVWGDNAGGDYDIVGMFISGLSTSTPVAGSVFTIAGGAGDQNFPDVDYDSTYGAPIVTWLVGGGGTIAYRYIPEPASLSLLALGGLAFVRRRR